MTDYKHFGVMIDCSRNAVLKVSALKKMIDNLQIMGYTSLELYTEDTYEVRGEPYFGYLRGRYSVNEIKEIDCYAAAHGIELIPCIQTLAHFTNPVKLPRFAEITDVNDILLADEEKTYAFIEKIFASLAESFTSRKVNIGMDEAQMVGLGKYLDRHGASNRFEILCRHLERVIAIAAKYGFKAHMWSDMFFRLAAEGEYYGHDVKLPVETIKKIPQDVALTYWDYYHVDKEHFDTMIMLHKKLEREVWFAGGVWTWAGFVPHNRLARATMLPAMQSVRENGIENVLITMWGDNGGECPSFSALHTLYTVRRYADGEYDSAVINKEFEKLFSISADDFVQLELPDIVPDITNVLELANPSKGLLYSDPFLGILDAAAEAHKDIPYSEYTEKLHDIKNRVGEYAYLFNTAEKLSSLMEIKAFLGVRTRKAYNSNIKQEILNIIDDYDMAVKRLDDFFAAFTEQWFKINKPFGFEVHCARIGGVRQRLLYCKARLKAFACGDISCIEELDSSVLPLDSSMPGNLLLNDYRHSISTSEI